MPLSSRSKIYALLFVALAGAAPLLTGCSATARNTVVSNVADFGGTAGRLWAVTKTGVFETSTDNGRTWTRLPLPTAVSPRSSVVFDATVQAKSVWISAYGAHRSGVYESDSSGRRWARVWARSGTRRRFITGASVQAGAAGSVDVVDVVAPSNGMPVAGSTWFYRASSATAMSLSSPIPLPTYGTLSEISPRVAVLVGGPGDQRAYESTDGERTWKRLTIRPAVPRSNFSLGSPVTLGTALFIPVTTLPADGSTHLDLYPTSVAAGTSPGGPVLALLVPGVTGASVSTSSADGAVWAVSPDGSRVSIATSTAGWRTVSTHGLPAGVTITAISPTRAFALERDYTCHHKINCVLNTGLYATTDRGRRWSAVKL